MAAFYLDLGDVPTARVLIEQQLNAVTHTEAWMETLQLALFLRLQRYEEALQFAEEKWQQHPTPKVADFLSTLYSLSDQYQLALGINDQRIELYGDSLPHPETKVVTRILALAINRAAILVGLGENARAQRLLNNCLDVAKSAPDSRWYLRQNFLLVQIYALLGDVPNALLALRASIDEGSRSGDAVRFDHFTDLGGFDRGCVDGGSVLLEATELADDLSGSVAQLREPIMDLPRRGGGLFP